MNLSLRATSMNSKQVYKTQLEEIILCVMLNDLESFNYISEQLNQDDFSDDYKNIYSKIVKLRLDETDSLLIEVKLIREFSAAKVNELKSKVPIPSLSYLLANKVIQSFKDVIFSLKAEDFLNNKLNEIQKDYNGLDALESLSQDIQDLLRTKDNLRAEKSFTEKLPGVLQGYEQRLNSSNEHSLNIRNIPSLNTSTGGIQPSNLLTIAGFTGQGKTFLSLNLILDLAKQGIPSGYISLEQSESEIFDRLIGMLTGLPSNKLRNPKKLSEEELKKLNLNKLSQKDLPLYINDRPLTEIEIKQKIKYWKDRFNVKIVCIDYLGLMQSRNKFTSRERELTYYSEFLKLAAKELDVIIIILSQLNRSGKEKPSIENLAESIGLARDSDFLFTIFKPIDAGIKSDEAGNKFDDSHFILRCEKNRHNKSKKQIALKMKESGEFIELCMEPDKEIEQIFDERVIKR